MKEDANKQHLDDQRSSDEETKGYMEEEESEGTGDLQNDNLETNGPGIDISSDEYENLFESEEEEEWADDGLDNNMDEILTSGTLYEKSQEFRVLYSELMDDGEPPIPPDDDRDLEDQNHFRFVKTNLTLQEMSTVAWASIKIEHRISRSADMDLRLYQETLSNAASSNALQPGEIRKVRSTLQGVTGLQLRKYGRCPNNCVAYDPEDKTTTHCPEKKCGLPRFKVRFSNISHIVPR